MSNCTYPTELVEKAKFEIRTFERVSSETSSELLAEVIAWRAQFPAHEYRALDNGVTLKIAPVDKDSAISQRKDGIPPLHFTRVEDAMPEEIITDGAVNCVLAVWKEGIQADYVPNTSVCNVAYFNAHPDEFTHWMYLPTV